MYSSSTSSENQKLLVNIAYDYLILNRCWNNMNITVIVMEIIITKYGRNNPSSSLEFFDEQSLYGWYKEDVDKPVNCVA